MRTPVAVFHILSDGRFHSGAELGRSLGVSRAAVWKAIQKLKHDWGVMVHAVPGKGYKLPEKVEMLARECILGFLSAACRQRLGKLEILKEVDSTNRYLLDAVASGAQSGDVVLAEYQTAGRGRRGRFWLSPFAQNLYFSLYWQFDLHAARLAGLSLAMAVAISRALEKLGLNEVGLKWPNDLHWRERKLCGILLEMRGEAAGPWQVIIGVGLNIKMNTTLTARIEQPWVDLASVLAETPGRNQVAAVLLEELTLAAEQFQQYGLEAFRAEWRARDIISGRKVELHLPDAVVSGVARGIDASGALCLEQNGRVRAYHAGDVSLRLSHNG